MANSDTTQASASGIGFFGLLTIVFIVLKLTHVIDWSWWYVLAPVLWPLYALAAGGLLLGIVLIGAWVLDLVNTNSRKKKLAASKRQ